MKLSNDDKAIFQDAMKDVEPLASQNRIPHKNTLTKIHKRRDDKDAKTTPDTLSDHEYLDSVNAEDTIEYFAPGVQARLKRQLRQGKIHISAQLDCHGLTVAEARVALIQFLQQQQECSTRCVRIIHGKGHRSQNHPILKNKINHWLRRRDEVFAFCSAQTKDGGTGAVYVLLRKKNN